MDEAFTVFFRTFPQIESAKIGPRSGSELSADFSSSTPASHLAHVDLGPLLWRDEAGFEWVQKASGRWYSVDNPAVHFDAPGCLAFSSWGVFRPSCNDRSQGRVQAELGSLFMRHSTWLWKNFLHFLLASYLAVTRPVLPVNTGT